MPRKTKKKKIIADYRKRMSRLAGNMPSQTVQKSPVSTAVSKPGKAAPIKREPSVDHGALSRQRAVIVRDLKKTLILSTLAIGSLVVISLVPAI